MTETPIIAESGYPGFELITRAPEAFAAYIRAEHALWGKLLKERGIRAE